MKKIGKIFALILVLVTLFVSYVPASATEKITDLIITEVCYNSPDSADDSFEDIYDYIEIVNISDKEISINGAELVLERDGLEYATGIISGIENATVKPGQVVIISVCHWGYIFNDALDCQIENESYYALAEVPAELEFTNEGTDARISVVLNGEVLCEANYNPEKHNKKNTSVIYGISETQGYHLLGTAAMTPGEIYPELIGLGETEHFTEKMKIMTYNICASGVKSDFPGKVEGQEYVEDASLYIDQRYDEIAAFILEESPDVLCLNELNKEWWVLLGPELTDKYGYCGISSGTGNEAENLTNDKWDTIPMILYDKAKFKVVESGSFTCPPDERGLTTPNNWAILKNKDTGASFMVMTQHLVAGKEAVRQNVRKASAELIVGKIPELSKDLPVIVMGDYNSAEGTDTYDLFIDNGFKDAARMNPDTEIKDTCPGWYQDTTQTYRDLAIDIFMLSEGDFNVNSYTVVEKYLDNGFAYSDHSPVVIEVEMRKVESASDIMPVIIIAVVVAVIVAAVVLIVVKLKKKSK